ncbi:hypothetical protein [Sphingobacterium multivorum]|uniref:hypothetical protein n=1 Tax=Sphingobacterium multivorum TaxID=28454 RepID=UPI003DA43407
MRKIKVNDYEKMPIVNPCLFRRCWGRDFGVIGPIISLVIGALSDYNNIQFD